MLARPNGTAFLISCACRSVISRFVGCVSSAKEVAAPLDGRWNKFLFTPPESNDGFLLFRRHSDLEITIFGRMKHLQELVHKSLFDCVICGCNLEKGKVILRKVRQIKDVIIVFHKVKKIGSINADQVLGRKEQVVRIFIGGKP